MALVWRRGLGRVKYTESEFTNNEQVVEGLCPRKFFAHPPLPYDVEKTGGEVI